MQFVDIKKIKHIHFVGIGGIGVSALARMMIQEGKKVSGSDNSISEITEELKKLGAEIKQGHNKDNVGANVDLVVCTAAVPKENPEVMEAHQKHIQVVSYSVMLGMVSEGKKVIAVSGTHGKTTTTAMLADILVGAGLDPTVVVGSLLLPSRTNFIAGESDIFLTEADEYKKSFLSLSPYVLVITNIDLDHLDFYKDLEDIQDAFSELVSKIPHDGFLICNTQHPHLIPVIEKAKCTVIDYSSVDKLTSLKVPGKHNQENAQAACAVANTLKVSKESIEKSLSQFRGAWRRFEFKGKTKGGALVYDDYAHNPQKVRAVIEGARELFPQKKIVLVFQPHLYSRTKTLLSEFASSLGEADEVLLLPIFGAREVFDSTISSEMLAEKTSAQAKTFSDTGLLKKYLDSSLTENDVCLLVGAGDIYLLAEGLVV
ncbi:MAG: UDP-N-acetylmuramate--L-alanine ligase, UDP-N-acetylmuramate--alanine ligase [Candidatus Parcubacteria bacterium]